MTPLQKKLLSIIEKIDAICRKHGITYFLGGGTALGAIRHRGFLPWDDDADMYITRDNWDKLKNILKDELPPGLTLVTKETHPHYRNPLCRIVDEETAMFYRTRVADETPHGVQVEFFILDPIPNCEKERTIYFKNRWLYIELLAPYFLLANDRLPEEITDINTYVKKRIQSKIFGEKRILAELEEKLFHYKLADCEDVTLRWGQRIIIYDKKLFESAVYVDFEHIKLPVSHQVIRQLRYDYGDSWMIVPNSEEQIVHISWGDLNTSYLEHMKYIEKYIDLADMRKNLLKRKTRNVLRYKHQNAIKNELLSLQKVAKKLRLTQILKENEDLQQLFIDKQYFKIVENFKEYMIMQTDPSFVKRNIWIEIQDEFLYPIIFSMVMVGNYFDAGKILKIRAEKNLKPNDPLAQMDTLIHSISEVNVNKYSNNLSIYEDEVEAILESFPLQIDMIKAKIALHLYEKRNLEEIESLIRVSLEIYEEDGELLSYLGDLYYDKNLFEEALNTYQLAHNKTRNGIVLQKISDRIKQLS